MKIYGDIISGNCYKIALLASILDIDHQWVHTDIMAGETRTREFLAMNPNGKIPLLALDDGEYLWESNAILNYLASDTNLLPDDRFLLAQVFQWQFFEQYSHEPCIAVARFIKKFLGLPEERKLEFERKQTEGMRALAIMEAHLDENSYFVGDGISVADISLYAYTHVAHEGGFDLSGFPAIRAWLQRIASEPKYVGMV